MGVSKELKAAYLDRKIVKVDIAILQTLIDCLNGLNNLPETEKRGLQKSNKLSDLLLVLLKEGKFAYKEFVEIERKYGKEGLNEVNEKYKEFIVLYRKLKPSS